MSQPKLFETSGPTGTYGHPIPVPPRDRSVGERESRRLGRQSRSILERLRRGPASNAELATIALNYRARISDLRAVGCTIEVSDRDPRTGRALYTLQSAPSDL